MSKTMEIATLGAGCFWCVEAIYSELHGVLQVVPGYMGGEVRNPSYREVCEGKTGHAEVAQITFEPSVVDFRTLLEVFFQTHDPTTLNRQGNDVGTQYRSVIFYHSHEQMCVAKETLRELNESGAFASSIVTDVTEAQEFYVAENYHHDYFKNNPGQAYCSMVIRPKMEKFRRVFNNRLK